MTVNDNTTGNHLLRYAYEASPTGGGPGWTWRCGRLAHSIIRVLLSSQGESMLQLKERIHADKSIETWWSLYDTPIVVDEAMKPCELILVNARS